MTYRNKRILEGARDKPCVLCGATGTTVACHSNALEHGHGMGHKSPDYMVAYLCQTHHDLVDGRAGGLNKIEKRQMWLEGFIKTVPIWFESGIVE